MPANECIPYKVPGDSWSAKADGAITGKRFVVVSKDRTGGGGKGAGGSTTVGVGLSTDLENLYQVKQAGAKGVVAGVSSWDAADKAELKVYSGPGYIVPVTAGGTLAAGDLVESDAEGKAVKANATPVAGAACGIAMSKASAAEDAEIKLI